MAPRWLLPPSFTTGRGALFVPINEGSSLVASGKTREGANNPGRDAHFGVINYPVKTAMADNQRGVSVARVAPTRRF